MPNRTTTHLPGLLFSDEFIEALATALAAKLNGSQSVPATPQRRSKRGVLSVAEAPESVEEDEAEDEVEAEDQPSDDYDSWSDAKLRKECLKREYDDDEVAEADREQLIANLRDDDEAQAEAEAEEDDEVDEDEEAEEDEEADEDEDEEEDEEEAEAEYSREELAEKSLSELKAIAREQGFTNADLRGQDEDSVVDMILEGPEEEEEDEADEDEAEEDEADELDEAEDEADEEDGEGYTLDELIAMGENNRAELIAEAEAWGITVKKGSRVRSIAKAIWDANEAWNAEQEAS